MQNIELYIIYLMKKINIKILIKKHIYKTKQKFI